MSRYNCPFEVVGRSLDLLLRCVYCSQYKIGASRASWVEYDGACPLSCGRLNGILL